MRVFFSLPDTNSVRQFLLEIHFFFWIFTFLDDHRPTNYFYRVFWPFPFCLFFFFLFLFLQHKIDKTRNAIFFLKTSFLSSLKFCKKKKKNTILAQCDTICVFKNTQKHYTNGGKQWKKQLGLVFNFKLGPVFNFKPPNPGPAFNFTAYIYVCKRTQWVLSSETVLSKQYSAHFLVYENPLEEELPFE